MKKITVFLILMSGFYGVSQKNLNLKKGYVAKGYDVTEYFNNKAVKGKNQYCLLYEGAVYLFKNEDNRDKFKSNPHKYMPQYGGYCAYAIGKNGKKVGVDPKTFKITDEKLYLFYNSFGMNTLKSWNKEDPEKLLIQADKNWKEIIKN